MGCINCENNDISNYYEEVIPCKHCGNDTIIDYFVCNACGIMWKEIDGEVIDNSADAEDAINELFPENEYIITDDFIDLFKDGSDINYFELDLSDKSSMQDMIHKCIRCNATSFEIKPRLYHCPDCGFEWEIL